MKTVLSSLLPQFLKNLNHARRAKRAAKKYDYPSKKLKVIGVTGTDGKTSTSTMLYEILRAADKKVGIITTISAKVGDKEYTTGFHVTTPDSEPLQKFLREMVDRGLEYVVLESTSHGLDQNRLHGIEYYGAVVTNVTHEHLDYHKTYERYLATKAKLLKQLNPKHGFAVLNQDDFSYDLLSKVAQQYASRTLTYGLTERSDIFATDLNEEVEETEFITNYRGEEYKTTMHMPGQYNVYNALAATLAASALGVNTKDIQNGLKQIKGIEGRWEVMQEKPFKVVVDFAHTPNALHNVLRYAQEENARGKVIVVFGSAGKRDRMKRPAMGKEAGTFADLIVLTAEDPRGESVKTINRQIGEGLKLLNKVKGKDYVSILNRRKAIAYALDEAKPGDTVIITGKGHEKSMNLDGKVEQPWSDQNAVSELLSEMTQKA